MPGRDGLQQRGHLPQSVVNDAAGGSGEPAGERFDFYTVMPESRRALPPETPGEAPAVLRTQAGTGHTVDYVLQIEGFSSLEETRAMQDKLAFMRLGSRIETGHGRDGYRIRLGPYADMNELEQVQSRLGKRGIKSTRERLP